MKAVLRIPTEQYAFMEVEVDVESLQEAREKYLELQSLAQDKIGLSVKEWNSALDKYLSTNKLTEDEYVRMSPIQQNIIQEVKRSIKRINYNKDEN